mmetsp:Transcript_4889/g.9693  ORF Transcript_4889/g.9693 Transcript_4889/m.9693 type:complete len:224 (-) Transcript_4889:286-957(-)
MRIGPSGRSPFHVRTASLLQHLDDERKQKSSRLTRSRLRTCHEIFSQLADGNTPFLHGSGTRVPAQLRTAGQIGSNGSLVVIVHGLGHVISANLYGNVIILVKVDPRHLLMFLLVQLAFQTVGLTHVSVKSAFVAAGTVTASVVAATSVSTSAAAAVLRVVPAAIGSHPASAATATAVAAAVTVAVTAAVTIAASVAIATATLTRVPVSISSACVGESLISSV